ncbi:MAG: HAD family hydrolase [bacterium]
MAKIKGIVFDMDGTLYNQNILRILVAGKMILAFIVSPKKFSIEFKIIREFRKVQEKLRLSDSNVIDENSQIRKTAENLKMNYDEVSQAVDKWFKQIPLPLISICRKSDLVNTFSNLFNEGFKLGLFSDYPSEDKAKILGIKDFVEAIVCSSDADVGKFKPAADGFKRIAEKLNLKCENLIYVGDRYEVDIVGALKAGMIPLLVGKFQPGKKLYSSCFRFKTIEKLIKKINNSQNNCSKNYHLI